MYIAWFNLMKHRNKKRICNKKKEMTGSRGVRQEGIGRGNHRGKLGGAMGLSVLLMLVIISSVCAYVKITKL